MFLKAWTQPAASAPFRHLIELELLRSHPMMTEAETWESPNICVLTNSPSNSHTTEVWEPLIQRWLEMKFTCQILEISCMMVHIIDLSEENGIDSQSNSQKNFGLLPTKFMKNYYGFNVDYTVNWSFILWINRLYNYMEAKCLGGFFLSHLFCINSLLLLSKLIVVIHCDLYNAM